MPTKLTIDGVLRRELRRRTDQSKAGRESFADILMQTGINQSVLARFANGERDIRLSTAAKLADYLGLELRPRA